MILVSSYLAATLRTPRIHQSPYHSKINNNPCVIIITIILERQVPDLVHGLVFERRGGRRRRIVGSLGQRGSRQLQDYLGTSGEIPLTTAGT